MSWPETLHLFLCKAYDADDRVIDVAAVRSSAAGYASTLFVGTLSHEVRRFIVRTTAVELADPADRPGVLPLAGYAHTFGPPAINENVRNRYP